MPQVQLSAIASARSGDKGEGSNVGLIAHSEANLTSKLCSKANMASPTPATG